MIIINEQSVLLDNLIFFFKYTYDCFIPDGVIFCGMLLSSSIASCGGRCDPGCVYLIVVLFVSIIVSCGGSRGGSLFQYLKLTS